MQPLRLLLSIALVAACGSGDKGSDSNATTDGNTATGSTGGATGGSATTTATTAAMVEPPAAPTDLMASILEGGVHLTWKDASDNEDNFIVENRMVEVTDFSQVIELPFDSVTYHDINVQSGMTYVYRVKAVNTAGEALSNEVMIAVP